MNKPKIYEIPFDQVDKSEFLTRYWQKAACLFKGALLPTEQLISAEVLAGLALEQDVESRIVSNKNAQWTIAHGPFEDDYFANLPEHNWTLLVQSVDGWLLSFKHLLANFNFLPRWRFDDVMVSYATDGGGVGPHADNYDVFLVQSSGQRRWRVGEMGDTTNAQIIIDGMSHLSEFDPLLDCIMEPGDILYIPPDTPHWGESVGESMGYSVGYRSLQTSQLFSILAEDLHNNSSFKDFFSDPYRKNVTHNNHLDTQMVEWAQSELKAIAEQPERIAQLIGKQLSLSKTDLHHNDNSFDIQQLTEDTSIKIDDVFSANWNQTAEFVYLNIEGESFPFEEKHLDFVTRLASYQSIRIKSFNFLTEPFDFPEVLTSLINRGYIKHTK